MRSKRIGTNFEEFFKAACNRHGFAWKHIPALAQVYGMRFGKPQYALKPSPFDFLIAGNIKGRPVSAYLDTKSTKGKTFPKSQIDMNQIDNLLPFEEVGHPAGYLIYFREVHDIVFVMASVIKEKNSVIKPSDGVSLGNIMTFDLKKMF